MPAKIFGPRKRRTRQHVIADQSVHHVEGFILSCGYAAERIYRDYGYDLVMATFDNRGYVEPGRVYFQIKASETLNTTGGSYVYDVDIRDYNLWLNEQVPVILVLYDALRGKAYWQGIQRYFILEGTPKPQKGAKWVRVAIPERQAMGRDAIAELRRRKNKGEL
jgi:Domain of unknown function (DUF4365)